MTGGSKEAATINKNLAILHCTASYPAKVEEMNLSVLNTYSKSCI